MDKRQLVKIPIETAKDEWVELAGHAECAEYLVSARVILSEGKKILLLHLYPQQQIRNGDTRATHRIFLNKTDYITQDLKSKSVKWLSSCMKNLVGYWNMDTRCLLVDEASNISMCSFLNCEDKPFQVLNNLQEEIMKNRLEEKHKLLTDEIDRTMNQVPDLPADFDRWVNETALYSSRYLFYRYKRGNTQSGVCSYCGECVTTEHPRHNTSGVCPACQSHVTFKALGRIGKYMEDVMWCALLQGFPEGIVVRYFKAYREYRDHPQKPVTGYMELIRDVYRKGGWTRYEWGVFRQHGHMRWCDETGRYGIPSVSVYSANLDELLANTQWKYSALRQMAEARPGFRFDLWRYLNRYLQYPLLEYLVKMRLYRLASEFAEGSLLSDCINKNGQSPKEVLKIDRALLPVIQEMDACGDEVAMLQQAVQNKIALTGEQTRFLVHHLGAGKNVLEMLTAYATLHKTIKYLRGQSCTDGSLKDTFGDWKDYIRFCKELQYDLTNEFVAFPKDLKDAHDRTNKLVAVKRDEAAAKKLEKSRQKIAAMYDALEATYGWKEKHYFIAAPKNASEITEEGQQLHHCVGTYLERVADGSCIILFLRRTEKPDEPFYTIEVRDCKVTQCRGKYNAPMTPVIEKLIQRYTKAVLSPPSEKTLKTEGVVVCAIKLPA